MRWHFPFRRTSPLRTLLLAPGVFAWGILDAAPETRNKAADGPRRLEWCSAIEVLSPQKSRFPHPRRFSAAQILDLEIRVLLPEKLTGEHRLDVSLYTPDHQLYQTLTVPFRGAGTPPSRGPRRKLTDHPRPIAEAEARATLAGKHRRTVVSAVLPVAGTSIVTSSLYGEWTAAAFLDGSQKSCGAAARFVITE